MQQHLAITTIKLHEEARILQFRSMHVVHNIEYLTEKKYGRYVEILAMDFTCMYNEHEYEFPVNDLYTPCCAI